MADFGHIALGSGWDMDLLKAELCDLSLDFSMDVGLTGFSSGEIDVIPSTGDSNHDFIPQAPVEPRAKRGDVWNLRGHRIGCVGAHLKAVELLPNALEELAPARRAQGSGL
jgi:hypothetical protein